MTTATVTPLPVANPRRRPTTVNVDRHELVGRFLDGQSLAWEAIQANGASLELVLRMPPGPWRDELQLAHIAAHDRLVKLIAELRMGAGLYDTQPGNHRA